MKLGNCQALFAILILAANLAAASEPAEKTQNPPSSDDGVAVMKVSEPQKVTRLAADPAAGRGPEGKFPASAVLTRPLMPAPDLEICRLPELTVEILEPATGRAVIREGSNPPRVVRPGSALADTSAVVRQIGFDKLVADVDDGDGGRRPVLWIFAAEEPGGRSRVQCFVAATSPQPAPGADPTEPATPVDP